MSQTALIIPTAVKKTKTTLCSVQKVPSKKKISKNKEIKGDTKSI